VIFAFGSPMCVYAIYLSLMDKSCTRMGNAILRDYNVLKSWLWSYRIPIAVNVGALSMLLVGYPLTSVILVFGFIICCSAIYSLLNAESYIHLIERIRREYDVAAFPLKPYLNGLWYNKEPVVLTLIGVLLLLTLGPFGIISLFVQLVSCLLNIVFSVAMIAAMLTFPISALLIAGVFSCPREDGFDAWFQTLISNLIAEQEAYKQGSKQEEIRSLWDYLPTRQKLLSSVGNWMFSLYASNFATTGKRFYHLGFCQIVSCDVKDGNGTNRMFFVGAFNTWYPLSGHLGL
jgi:hypothetical protein